MGNRWISGVLRDRERKRERLNACGGCFRCEERSQGPEKKKVIAIGEELQSQVRRTTRGTNQEKSNNSNMRRKKSNSNKRRVAVPSEKNNKRNQPGEK
jgi:hypothetical protein